MKDVLVFVCEYGVKNKSEVMVVLFEGEVVGSILEEEEEVIVDGMKFCCCKKKKSKKVLDKKEVFGLN